MTNRTIRAIAQDIKTEWKKVYFGAVPYLDAMLSLSDKTSNYYEDRAETIVIYFLSNASTFRGERAKELKAELKQIIK